MDTFLQYAYARAQTELSCPTVDPQGCAGEGLPPHTRNRSNHFFRLDPGFTIGTGKGVQLFLGVPVYVQLANTRYVQSNGLDYTPTYDHADPGSLLVGGLADGRVGVRYLGSVGPDAWTLGIGVGLSLPFAPHPRNPLTSLDADVLRTVQAGSGTVDPTVDMMAIKRGERWGAWFSLAGRFGLYTTPQGYRPPTSGSLSAGPSIQVAPKATLLITGDVLVESASLWNTRPVGGRIAVMPSVMGVFPINPSIVLQARAAATAWERGLSPDRDPVGPLVSLAFGVSWTSKMKAAQP